MTEKRSLVAYYSSKKTGPWGKSLEPRKPLDGVPNAMHPPPPPPGAQKHAAARISFQSIPSTRGREVKWTQYTDGRGEAPNIGKGPCVWKLNQQGLDGELRAGTLKKGEVETLSSGHGERGRKIVFKGTWWTWACLSLFSSHM